MPLTDLILVSVVLIVPVGIGLATKFFITSRLDKEDGKDERISPVRVLDATSLLAALLLAIVLADAGASYSAARSAAKAEADTVDTLFESAEYVTLPERQTIQAAAVCYARAVVGPEWAALSSGRLSPVPSAWTGTGPGGIRATLIKMTPEAQGFGLVQSADQTRGNQRSERLVQSQPTVPGVLFWFLVFLVGLSLGALSYSIPRSNNRAHIVALMTVAVLFGAVLLMISNFDRPFSGLLALQPSAMQKTEDDDAQDYAGSYGVPLPCDDQGNRLG